MQVSQSPGVHFHFQVKGKGEGSLCEWNQEWAEHIC